MNQPALATARRLPDHLLCEQALAEYYGADQLLADPQSRATVIEAEETAPTLAIDQAADLQHIPSLPGLQNRPPRNARKRTRPSKRHRLLWIHTSL
jgi:hypothetical protein